MRGPGRPRKGGEEEKRRTSNLPDGYLARGVPGDYDGSWGLPDAVHERFAQLVASGSTATSAIKTAHPKGHDLATPIQSARSINKKEQVQRRIRFLREQKARTLASEDSLFEGFIHAVEQAMQSISDLVKLATNEGLHREAAAARGALGSLAGRTYTHRESLQNADQRGRFADTRAKAVLREVLGEH